jgi:hypothetical protein
MAKVRIDEIQSSLVEASSVDDHREMNQETEAIPSHSGAGYVCQSGQPWTH